MVGVAPEDRDVLRLLWIDDILTDNPTLLIKRFTRVIFGVSSSPFLSSGTVSHHIEKYEEDDPDFVAQVLRSLYVDDLISGNNTLPAAFKFYILAKGRLAEAGFNLRKFITNSDELRELIEKNERSRVDLPSNVGPQADQRAEKTIESETFAKSSARKQKMNLFSDLFGTMKLINFVLNFRKLRIWLERFLLLNAEF